MAQFYNKPGRTISVAATATVGANLFATLGGGLPATVADALGVTQMAYASGDQMTLVVDGIVPVLCSAAIVAGAFVEVNTDGTVKTKASGTVVGRALTATSATGELCSVFLSGRVV